MTQANVKQSTTAALPLIAVTGMAFEAQIVRGEGVEVVYGVQAGVLRQALAEAVARGCSGIISIGTAGGLSPELAPGALLVADAVEGPLGRYPTDPAWSARLMAALMATSLAGKTQRGLLLAAIAPLLSAADKTSLHRVTGADAVDMESYIAAEVAQAHGLPFAACRTIVDPAWRTLPKAAMAGLLPDGSTAVLPVLRELLREPSQLGALLRVAADARAARSTLVQARQVLAETGALYSV
ncbi:phosphorylase [Paraburkholderia bonniea]|uniref:phosphorylase n=1 Tax=Paraburkholderia bonniea TaxID=2152891 RepID=UPI001290F6E4|nr:phosphorylase [Paraburkholderia bonniea]WJF91833.1 phosphorylase [Paraburkholderia bonniea]WJF95152.1 phosphorylase [Paraburkholderia bonniea]